MEAMDFAFHGLVESLPVPSVGQRPALASCSMLSPTSREGACKASSASFWDWDLQSVFNLHMFSYGNGFHQP
jgi:hypothetical protein